ncbi:MAG: HTH domain-containing protein, partial [Armatimonadetes bacterium]|nr:HTH domain-containing protein [Armatimonadota bacterium]
MPRAERLFALVTTLDSRRGKRPAELARDLGVHRSTIHRDLLALQGLGIGIVSGPEGYRLLRGA